MKQGTKGFIFRTHWGFFNCFSLGTVNETHASQIPASHLKVSFKWFWCLQGFRWFLCQILVERVTLIGTILWLWCEWMLFVYCVLSFGCFRKLYSRSVFNAPVQRAQTSHKSWHAAVTLKGSTGEAAAERWLCGRGVPAAGQWRPGGQTPPETTGLWRISPLKLSSSGVWLHVPRGKSRFQTKGLKFHSELKWDLLC